MGLIHSLSHTFTFSCLFLTLACVGAREHMWTHTHTDSCKVPTSTLPGQGNHIAKLEMPSFFYMESIPRIYRVDGIFYPLLSELVLKIPHMKQKRGSQFLGASPEQGMGLQLCWDATAHPSWAERAICLLLAVDMKSQQGGKGLPFLMLGFMEPS